MSQQASCWSFCQQVRTCVELWFVKCCSFWWLHVSPFRMGGLGVLWEKFLWKRCKMIIFLDSLWRSGADSRRPSQQRGVWLPRQQMALVLHRRAAACSSAPSVLIPDGLRACVYARVPFPSTDLSSLLWGGVGGEEKPSDVTDLSNIVHVAEKHLGFSCTVTTTFYSPTLQVGPTALNEFDQKCSFISLRDSTLMFEPATHESLCEYSTWHWPWGSLY